MEKKWLPLSTRSSAVRAKHCSFQNFESYIRERMIFSIKYCGLVPCTFRASFTVRLAIVNREPSLFSFAFSFSFPLKLNAVCYFRYKHLRLEWIRSIWQFGLHFDRRRTPVLPLNERSEIENNTNEYASTASTCHPAIDMSLTNSQRNDASLKINNVLFLRRINHCYWIIESEKGLA